MPPNRLSKIAIVGAGGHSGRAITTALLATGTHTITALTRTDSTTPLPSGVQVARVDYSDPESLISALRGQDALVITLASRAPAETSSNLHAAAAAANVPWILPNEWCPDLAHEGLRADVPWFAGKLAARDEIARLGTSSYIAVATGFWYEWMLAIPAAYGFDFARRSVTLFDEGSVRVSQSTWPQVGRAVAALLSLPVEAEDGDEERCLARLRNSAVAVQSFCVSQEDILQSAMRVTGTRRDEWTIERESSAERLRQGVEGMKKGDYAQAPKVCTRVFFDDGCGNVEDKVINKMLGLPEEDLDEATKAAIERSANPFA